LDLIPNHTFFTEILLETLRFTVFYRSVVSSFPHLNLASYATTDCRLSTMISTESLASHRNRLSLVQLFNVTLFIRIFWGLPKKGPPAQKALTKTTPQGPEKDTKHNN